MASWCSLNVHTFDNAHPHQGALLGGGREVVRREGGREGGREGEGGRRIAKVLFCAPSNGDGGDDDDDDDDVGS
ncbi:hypothetical protein CBR_g50282 [Chara braunii]|uniref:Uncharacterized protein n=1 Tax=Chara braunii TaxID=69332 RepID=A0A388K5A6_CHABU|nr:hypothetical protein CBR_g50282 [Chara braunii]|eukprot:GBG65240.1 hypothetical protein CBR_g50282 [Chara braunii]